MAILGIDHIVVIGNDLDTLIATYRAAGFTVTPGREASVGNAQCTGAYA